MTVSRHGVDAMREKVAGLRRLHTALEGLLAGKPRFLSVLRELELDKIETEIGPVFARCNAGRAWSRGDKGVIEVKKMANENLGALQPVHNVKPY